MLFLSAVDHHFCFSALGGHKCWPGPQQARYMIYGEMPFRHRVTDLILFVVLYRWGLMVLSLHRSRCTSFMKSNCSATRTSPTLTQGPQVHNVHRKLHFYKMLHSSAHFFSFHCVAICHTLVMIVILDCSFCWRVCDPTFFCIFINGKFDRMNPICKHQCQRLNPVYPQTVLSFSATALQT